MVVCYVLAISVNAHKEVVVEGGQHADEAGECKMDCAVCGTEVTATAYARHVHKCFVKV